MKESVKVVRTLLGILLLLVLFYGVVEEEPSLSSWELAQTGKGDKAYRPSGG